MLSFDVKSKTGGRRQCFFEVLSKTGERRQNEDYAGTARHGEAFCFVLADGLGGHGGGGEASRLAAESVLHDFEECGEVSETYLRKCFENAQSLLLKEQEVQDRKNEMKTTLVVLLVDACFMQWGHVGDSRLYFYRNRKFQKRTLDHSVPQMLAAAGEIKEKEIRRHADRNRLLRVLGTEWESPRYELSQVCKRRGREAFLLCSDGFWEWVEDKTMQSALKKAKSPAEWLAEMEQKALLNGAGNGMDNYSAVTVFLD